MAASAVARRVTPVEMTEASSDASTIGTEAEVDGAFNATGKLTEEGKRRACNFTIASAAAQALSSLLLIVSQASAFER